ncbi:MAG TPA: hypothetical protein VL172_10630, partial [Kofleriaceae bacterium]|nr:hypothetical protein [Kofleriaceae bacterium]
MSGRDDEIDRAIQDYCHDLQAEAELARGDLHEIEDHMRSLVDELRGRGLPVGAAIAEAARRLGEPRALAREHARVSSPFGARLSRARAWSAAALLAPMLAWLGLYIVPVTGAFSRAGMELVVGSVLVLALVARRAWARPVLLGGMAFFVLPAALWAALVPGASPLWMLWHLGIAAFLAPWRRRELTPAGWALALHVWTYGAAAFALGFQVTTNDGSWNLVAPASQVALGAAMLATAGSLLRARWAALASLLAAAALAAVVFELWGLRFRFDHATAYRAGTLALIA